VESSCELGNELLGSIKYWELPSGCTSCGLSSGTQLHRVSSVNTVVRDAAHTETCVKGSKLMKSTITN
jgi:hypothetical protein